MWPFMIPGMLMLVVLAACTQVPEQAEEEVRLRGHAFRTEAGVVFEACEADSSRPLRDVTRTERLEGLMSDLGQGGTDRIFVDILAKEQDEGLEIVSLEHAAHETAGCAEDQDFLWKAGGNEPFWSFRVGLSETRVSRVAAEIEEWTFATPSPQVEGRLWRYSPGQLDGQEIVLELRRNPCRDSMAGHFFAYSAVLRIGEERLTGCARAGADMTDPGPDTQP
ncbi:hypothetical protein ACFOW6_04505 [Fodinicurvata halophila]|uniref:Lipoprotein n=1 Tax=Fodinicurvata halophila TaxID=1419723 RepID=A0ABV8UIY6_9PROT